MEKELGSRVSDRMTMTGTGRDTMRNNMSAASSQFNQVSTRLTDLQIDDRDGADPSLIQLMNSNGAVPDDVPRFREQSDGEEELGYDNMALETDRQSKKKMKKKRQIEKNSIIESQSEGSCCAGGKSKCEIF